MTALKADIAAMETRSRKGQLKHLIFTAVDEFGLEAVQGGAPGGREEAEAASNVRPR